MSPSTEDICPYGKQGGVAILPVRVADCPVYLLLGARMSFIRIFLIDDHPKVLDQIAARLSDEDDIEVVGNATDCTRARALLEEIHPRPSVLIVDPVSQNGMEKSGIAEIMKAFPALAVIVLTVVVDTSLKVELGKLGIKDVLEKGIDSDKLVSVVRQVAAAHQTN